jgi:agmatinase
MTAPVCCFPFLSGNTFLRSLRGDTSKKLAVCGIPWDGCVTNRPGARFGPQGIRQASQMLCDGIHSLYDVSPSDVMTDLGDLNLPNTSLQGMRDAMMPLIKPMVEGHTMCWLGGDHSVTLPLLRQYRESIGRPVACIHFDAHCDTWVDHFGEPSGHGTWVYEAIQEGVIIPQCTFQFGIRSSGERSARDYVQDQGGMIFSGRALRGCHGLPAADKIVRIVQERLKAHGSPPVYITFDIDAIDPAFAPGTGTPEPGGLTTAQAMSLLEGFCSVLGDSVIGFDVVEVAPNYDHAELTTNAASTLAWTFLASQAARLERGAPYLAKVWNEAVGLSVESSSPQ